jgi:hypothetical protein
LSRPSGLRSSSAPRISAPETPSTVAWWIFEDEVHLPQRPRAIERSGEDARARLGEAGLVAGRGHRGLADVEVEVELRVLDPVGVIESERHLGQPPAKHGQHREPLGDQPAEVCDLDLAPGRTRRVIDRQPADVAEGARVLEREELRVEAGQLAHGSILPLTTIPGGVLPSRGGF